MSTLHLCSPALQLQKKAWNTNICSCRWNLHHGLQRLASVHTEGWHRRGELGHLVYTSRLQFFCTFLPKFLSKGSCRTDVSLGWTSRRATLPSMSHSVRNWIILNKCQNLKIVTEKTEQHGLHREEMEKLKTMLLSLVFKRETNVNISLRCHNIHVAEETSWTVTTNWTQELLLPEPSS